MAKDLRTYLQQLEQDLPDELLRIGREVEPEHEISGILWHLEKRGRYPAVLFERTRNLRGEPCEFKVASNLFASREKVALALGLPPEKAKQELSLEYSRRAAHPIKPEVIAPARAPVKQVVKTGEQANLQDFPIVTHHVMDAGPYMTMPVIGVDPDTGVHNASFQRMWVKGPRSTGISIAPRHLWDYYCRYSEADRPMPIAVVHGHHPAFGLGTMASIPIEEDEYEIMGGLLQEPLRLVPSETWGADLLVPADAEVVIEGYVLPHRREVEGPFGEFTGYYGGQKMNPLFEVTAINHRADAIWQTIYIGHRDSDLLEGVPIEGDLYNAIKPIVPTVKAVHVPPSGKTFNCYVSIKKRFEGAGKLAAITALPVHDFVKHVIVVDDDIDVYNEEEVLFALATRVQGDKDITVIPGIRGNVLDPSAEHGVVWTNTIIDATVPIDRPFEKRLSISQRAQAINLDDYLTAPDVVGGR